ncbi:MAG: acylphosphatase [Candidatus Levybacteria bacterium]|nr:acylphosphatase [Candidatus Levybacteria bacterium]
MLQAHVYISGFVQGVGFRAFVRSKARKMGITGWVRNLSDGRVEAILQGDRKIILHLVALFKRGSFFSTTTDIVVDWEEQTEEFKEFTKLATK